MNSVKIIKRGDMKLLNLREGDINEPSFTIKETYENIEKMKNNMEARVYSRLFYLDEIIVLFIGVRIDGEKTFKYWTYYNFYDVDHIQKLDKLVFSKRLKFSVYDIDNKENFKFSVKNNLSKIIRQYYKEAKRVPVTMDYINKKIKNHATRWTLIGQEYIKGDILVLLEKNF